MTPLPVFFCMENYLDDVPNRRLPYLCEMLSVRWCQTTLYASRISKFTQQGNFILENIIAASYCMRLADKWVRCLCVFDSGSWNVFLRDRSFSACLIIPQIEIIESKPVHFRYCSLNLQLRHKFYSFKFWWTNMLDDIGW